ncbi:MAG TPA: BON domain-containing protein [Terriglobales bacterium]|nr:BON domain-containing protein [Terriglobales bacterium]
MRKIVRILSLFLALGSFAVGASAATSGASQYDNAIQSKVTQKLDSKKQLRNVQASVEGGVVTLTGNVDLYQQKLDAAKRARKVSHVQGVHNLIAVAGQELPDAQLAARLDRKLYYDRIGYDNLFNFVTASVQDGVVVVSGETRTDTDRDSALSTVANTPGVKDVVNDIKVAPASFFDDQIRVRAARAIYRDPVLSQYAIDPAFPIRIVVENGHLSLYGTVASEMDKNVAGIRAGEVFGAFSVQNNLQVARQTKAS